MLKVFEDDFVCTHCQIVKRVVCILTSGTFVEPQTVHLFLPLSQSAQSPE